MARRRMDTIACAEVRSRRGMERYSVHEKAPARLSSQPKIWRPSTILHKRLRHSLRRERHTFRAPGVPRGILAREDFVPSERHETRSDRALLWNTKRRARVEEQ